MAYGQKLVFSGPIYKTMTIEKNRIRLAFNHSGSGVVVKGGGQLKHFAIAGTDRKFVWAQAAIDGDTVIVWHPDVNASIAVRYAWAVNRKGANLCNAEVPRTAFPHRRLARRDPQPQVATRVLGRMLGDAFLRGVVILE